MITDIDRAYRLLCEVSHAVDCVLSAAVTLGSSSAADLVEASQAIHVALIALRPHTDLFIECHTPEVFVG